MKKKRNIWSNNNGSTIIIVIVCIAFISIISTLLLTLTVNNFQMKAINRKAKSNFYTAESAFDEIKAGLEEVAADELENAYKEVMKQYISKTKEEKKQIFAKTFINGFADSFVQTMDGVVDPTKYNVETIEDYITNGRTDLEIPSGRNLMVKDANLSNPSFLTLKNIKISYTDGNNYKTTLSSDITIKTPVMNFTTGSMLAPAFTEYSLLADNMILLDAAQNVELRGNVYAGQGGIFLNNLSSLLMNKGTNIITKGDIKVAERSTLNIQDNPNVWARNIATEKGTDTENPTIINMDGTIYVADDFMLNAKNSEVTLTGEYYGYNYLANKSLPPTEINTPENSSAMIINGIKSNLDLSGLNNLFIAGRAYLDPTSRGNQSSKEQGKVQTGESLAIKGNQYAYLVPNEYMWSEGNPVTLDQYNSRGDGVPEVNYNKTLSTPFPIKLTDYVDGYSKIFYQLAGEQDFVYYYLKFKSEQKANEYMQKYYEVNNSESSIGIVDKRIKSYAKNIKLNSNLNSIISSGNLFTFSTNTGKSSLISNNVNPDSSGLEQIAMNLVSRYDSMKNELVEVPTGEPFDETSMFNSIANKHKIIEDGIASEYENGVKRVLIDQDYVVYIVDNAGSTPFVIQNETSMPHGGRQGIVIATGSIDVREDYTGFILSGENISLKPGVKVTASSNVVSLVLSKNHPDVNCYLKENVSSHFMNSSVDTDNTKVIVSDLIVFDNWKKNED